MKTKQEIQPPRWATRLLEWYCRPELLEDLQGDLHEFFLRNVSDKGVRHARFIYGIDVFKFMRLYTLRHPKPQTSMNNLIVFQNYFKTSVRNIARNKLFSAINIIGLAISMSVALMLIAFVSELWSYDTFHTNYKRIYRVNNTRHSLHGVSDFASTSILAGRKIKESVSGVDEVLILRRSFSKDLRVGDKVVPLEGLWADPSFFKLFSFELLSGNATTALLEPNSVVLTETSARKLFGAVDVTGKLVQIDTATYTVSAVMKDVPKNSHLRFDMLGSFITIDTQKLAARDKNWMDWDYMWQNYVYLLLPEGQDPKNIERQLVRICDEGNKTLPNKIDRIAMSLQPLDKIVLGDDLSNQIGPVFSRFMIAILAVLALVVIASACFNYANLSIARSFRRMREIGVRKVAGATRRQVFQQFELESVIIALISLLFSFLIFLLMRPGILSLDRVFQELVTLQPTLKIFVWFVGLAVGVGILAGLLPAFFFSKVNTAQVLKNFASVKLFGFLGMRKTLIVFQYTLSLLFIVSISLIYRQYQFSISYDLGLATENILNVELEGNKPEIVMKELAEVAEVKQISRSLYVPAIGTSWSDNVRYKDPNDSTTIYYNYVDENYLAVHHLSILAGENFTPALSANADEPGVIINEKLVRWMNLKSPEDAVGEEIRFEGEKFNIVGVVKDFHHNTLNNPINCFAFRYFGTLPASYGGQLNLKVQSADAAGMMNKLEAAWKKIDPVHPFRAEFYTDRIKKAYDELSAMIKIIGVLAFLAISISTLGLLGMVVFTTETRLKEISIRKILGATEPSLLYLMGKGFIRLLVIATAIAIPSAYLFFDQLVFRNNAFRAPIGFFDLFAGALVVLAIALLAISSQTLRVARVNPAHTLRSE